MRWMIQVVLSSLCMVTIQLHGHGFIADTVVDNFGKKTSSIKKVAQKVARGKKQYVSGWDDASSWESCQVRAVGHAHINYAITIHFDETRQHDVTCSPSQSFYNVDTKSWVPAYRLKSGDILLAQSGKSISVYERTLHKKPTTVYLLEVKKTHTFCVGYYRVLTHNTPLVCGLVLSMSGSFGAGAAAGATAGSFLGPITCAGGIIIGGLVGIGVRCLLSRGKIPLYHMVFDPVKIEMEDTSAKGFYGQEEQPQQKISNNQETNNAPNKSNKPQKGGTNWSKYEDGSLRKAKKSLLKQIEKHLKKLEEYAKNPDACDNKNFLKNAESNLELRAQIMKKRIEGLNTEITEFNQQISDILREMGRRGMAQ